MDTLKRTKSSLSQSKPSRKKQRLDEDVSNTEDPRTHPKFSAQDFTRQSKVVDAGNDEIVFQLIECEDASKDKEALKYLPGEIYDNFNTSSALLRLYGSTNSGESITVLVTGFFPYLYYPISTTFQESDTTGLREILEAAKMNIVAIEMVEREPLMYYRPIPNGKPADMYRHYVKIQVDSSSTLNALARYLAGGDQQPGLSELFQNGILYDTQVYESGLAYTHRFMVDKGLLGGGWVQIPSAQYQVIRDAKTPTKSIYDRVGIAIVCDASSIVGNTILMTEDSDTQDKSQEWSRLAPLRCLALQILEINDKSTSRVPPRSNTKAKATKRKKTSSPEDDDASETPPTFMAAISLTLTTSCVEETMDDITVVLTHSHEDMRSTLVSPNSRVFVLKDESHMLTTFSRLWHSYDADIITGYDCSENISRLVSRMSELGLRDMAKLSRLSNIEIKSRTRQTYSAAWVRSMRRMAGTSNREFVELTCPGRLVMDFRLHLEREERLRSYSMPEAVEFVLGRPKEHLDVKCLTDFWYNGTKGDRKRFVDYAMRESQFSLAMVRRSKILITNIEMARVVGLNVWETITRAQMIRMWSLLHRFAHANGIIVPTKRETNESGMTEGPLNWMPVTGYNTKDPCVVLDFRSLYPSIIIARNLDYSTLLNKSDRKFLNDDQYEAGKGPIECYFVKKEVKEGIIPRVLRHMLRQRGVVKQLLKNETDETMKVVYNGRQLALKIASNGIYGATGSQQSRLQLLEIAETTIVTAAEMLEQSAREIKSRYGHLGFKVVYGDTDSVFVSTPGLSVEEAIEWGKRMGREISEIWDDPIELQFEKVLFPTMLVNRKRYAGLQWTDTDVPQIIAKGIESERRDSIPLVNKVMTDLLAVLFPVGLVDPFDKQGMSQAVRQNVLQNAKDLVRRNVEKLLNGSFHVGEFVLTKGLWLGTEASDYKGKQAHIQVIEKVKKREPWREFKDGARIPFVYTQGAPNAKGYEKVEDPAFSMDEGLALDYKHYLTNQLQLPLTRLLVLLFPEKEVNELFVGNHTKFISTARPKVSPNKDTIMSSGSLASFLSKPTSASCLVCRRKIGVNERLCEDHLDLFPPVYHSLVKQDNDLGQRQTLLDAACHACSGSFDSVKCTNMDCKVYFIRQKTEQDTLTTQTDLTALQKQFDW